MRHKKPYHDAYKVLINMVVTDLRTGEVTVGKLDLFQDLRKDRRSEKVRRRLEQFRNRTTADRQRLMRED